MVVQHLHSTNFEVTISPMDPPVCTMQYHCENMNLTSESVQQAISRLADINNEHGEGPLKVDNVGYKNPKTRGKRLKKQDVSAGWTKELADRSPEDIKYCQATVHDAVENLERDSNSTFLLYLAAMLVSLYAVDKEHMVNAQAVYAIGILILFGMATTRTRMHMDQFGARCFGCAVPTPSPADDAGAWPLIAIWMFVFPSLASIKHIRSKIEGDPDLLAKFGSLFGMRPVHEPVEGCILGGDDRCPAEYVTQADMEKLVELCGQSHVHLRNQYHMTCMQLWPGWMHYVLNVRDNVKTTVEILNKREHLVHGVFYMHYFACKFFHVCNPEDYTNVIEKAETEVKEKVFSVVNRLMSR